MSAWTVDRGCPASCATEPDPRVPLGELARRYATLTYALTRAVARGDRLAEPEVLRTEARAVLGALGVGVERVEGSPSAERVPFSVRADGVGTLVVANHISWLDVVALLAVEPVSVLAKREVGRWPVVGALARRAGTRFIDRDGSPRGLPCLVAELADALRAGTSVLVFPQATTWCSVTGGRFRRAAFQAAVDAGAPVRPVTVEYRQGGGPSTAAAFLGEEDFTASLRRVAGARGLSVRVTASTALWGTDRRVLAAAARRAVLGTDPSTAASCGPFAPSCREAALARKGPYR
ncbi:1-acyl-sn-glycerol-3-phosphate acyltransferase [Streptomyces venezuelae]|uniref:1-acyl-sn-glycerol-3-phosphate acyltransferase n=1 Tax=Streptomyces venezuelae TaxID=54571 RepID=A0A5P2C616_STRVZ|nr:lysophospholipid acyltransferase family protein [Streptomyces venezuelae]QES37720.1 1-acyl-sn-glycerol-3-phosphate acyltransferase [Streptomyces venezuelae]